MKYLFILPLIIVTACSNAQGPKAALKKDFVAMNQALLDQNFDKVVEYMAEEVFMLVPEGVMIESLYDMMNSPENELVLSLPSAISIDKIEKSGDQYYGIIEAQFEQKVRYTATDGTVRTLDDPFIAQSLAAFKQALGEENVRYEKETNFMVMNVKQKSIAVSANGTTDWQFIILDPSTLAEMKDILPASVLERAK